MLFGKLGTRTEVPKNAKAAVVLRLDVVKDDSGSFAVFTEQGSSASQMTAATLLHAMFGLPECSGQASGAVSAYTQVTLEHAPKTLKLLDSECHTLWIRLLPTRWPKQWDKMLRSRGAAWNGTQRLLTRIVLEKPTQFLDQVDLGCTQGECESDQRIV